MACVCVLYSVLNYYLKYLTALKYVFILGFVSFIMLDTALQSLTINMCTFISGMGSFLKFLLHLDETYMK